MVKILERILYKLDALCFHQSSCRFSLSSSSEIIRFQILIMESNTIVFAVLMVTLGITTACFITNCPPGGKRSLPMNENAKKQCTRCGPSGIGRCFGPDICCGQAIGCQFKNRFTTVCATEDYSPHPCHNDGKSCANGKGVCALDSTCCTSDGCFVDKHCEQNRFKSTLEENSEGKWSNSIEL